MDGLLFDMGDVLYDATSWRRWLWRVLCRMGYSCGYAEFWRVWDVRFLDDVHRGRRDYGEAFQSFLRSRGVPWVAIDEIETASATQKRQFEAHTRPLIGVAATLAQLQSMGLVLGVLSDSESPATVILGRLRKWGIGDYFQVVVSSFDLERTKPDPVCYRTALKSMGVAPEQAAFVGHDADELSGAAAIGMRTIAFNYDAPVAADVHLRRFGDLLTACALGRQGVTTGSAGNVRGPGLESRAA